MKKIIFYTGKYKQELKDFYFEENNVLEEGENSNNYYFMFQENYLNVERFLEVLEDIIIEKNDIVRFSDRLCKTVKKNIFGPKHEVNLKELETHFEKENSINIDGYIDFRMNEYPMLIDEMLYFIVKKNLILEPNEYIF